MLEKGSFKFLPPSHWHECVLHVVTLKQSLQGSDSCEQRGGETASPAMLGFHHVKVLKIKISQRTNLHELWDYDPPVFSAITHGNKCYKSRLKPPSLPSSNPIIGSQGKHIFSYCKLEVIMNQDLLGVFYKRITHQHLKQQEEEHAVKITK